MLLSPYSFDSQEPVPEAKDVAVILEKRTMQTLRIVITLSHLSALHDAFRETLISQGDQ